MKIRNSFIKLTSLLIVMAVLSGMCTGICVSADTALTPELKNAGGIEFKYFFSNGSEMTAGGSYSGANRDIIPFKVYKDNKEQLLFIGEIRSDNNKWEIKFGVNPQSLPQTVIIEMKPQKQTETAQAKVSYAYLQNQVSPKIIIEKHKAEYAELTPLMNECKERGMNLDYDEINYNILGQFPNYMQEDFEKRDLDKIEYQDKVLTKLYEKTKTNLNAYLDGRKTPMSAPTYVTSDISVKGKHFEATVDDNGELKQQPVFFIGTGHWAPSRKDIPILSKFGFNAIQPEIGGWDFMEKASSGSGEYWHFNESVLNNIADDFDLMAENNLSGYFSAAPHYIPKFYYEDHPEIKVNGQANFTKIPFDHPIVKEYFEAYYNAIMPKIANKPAFDSIILMNEPIYAAADNYYYLPLFQEAMQAKYKTIDALNSVWGKSYTSFADVKMPVLYTASAPAPQNTDYIEFNDEILPRYNKFVSDLIKKYDTNVWTQTKMMQTLGKDHVARVHKSNNWETMAASLDINGCDAFSYYNDQDIHDIRGENLFYDYQTSVKEAPTCNTEDHIIQDGDTMNFVDGELEYNVATLWQGAVHGRGTSIIWFWDRENRSENGNYLHNPLLTERPDTVAAIGKTTLDLNRLANEVVAITESEANVGMLYVPINDFNANGYMNTMYRVYCNLGENGQKTQFIVESAMDKLNDMKCLVVPHVITVKDETFEAIEQFANNGGKLLVLGTDSLSKDEYGRKRDLAKVNAVMAKAEVININVTPKNNCGDLDADSKNRVKNAISNLVKTENYSDISIVDKATGKTLTDCEYLSAKYEGKYIVNLCNYADKAVEVTLKAPDGYDAQKAVDLISGKRLGSSFTIQPNEPVLLQIEDNSGISFSDSFGNPINRIIDSKMSAAVKYYGEEAGERLTHIVAVYENGVLKQISSNQTTNVDGAKTSQIDFEIDSGVDLSKCTVKSFLFDGFGNIKPMLPAKELKN